jgi:cobalt-zinc-cadmium efflux system membrane fusion protein
VPERGGDFVRWRCRGAMAAARVSPPAAHPKATTTRAAAAVTASNVTLTATSAEHPPLHRRTVQISTRRRDHRRGRFRQRSGHQRAGAVLRSGVAAAGFPGDKVKKGRRWRGWIRPTSRRPSAPIARRSPPRRRTAGWPIWTRILISTRRGPARRGAGQTDAANAEADRDAALQALVSLNVDPQTIKDIQEGRPVARIEA